MRKTRSLKEIIQENISTNIEVRQAERNLDHPSQEKRESPGSSPELCPVKSPKKTLAFQRLSSLDIRTFIAASCACVLVFVLLCGISMTVVQ